MLRTNIPAKSYVLIGFSGSGKSQLLRSLDPYFERIDLDELIEKNAQMSIGELVARYGWSSFRQLEREGLGRWLLRPARRPRFMATGAGVVEAVQKIPGVVIWLDTPFEVCWRRIQDCRERPLVQQGKAAMEELYCQRRSCYQALAHLRFPHAIGAQHFLSWLGEKVIIRGQYPSIAVQQTSLDMA